MHTTYIHIKYKGPISRDDEGNLILEIPVSEFLEKTTQDYVNAVSEHSNLTPPQKDELSWELHHKFAQFALMNMVM